MPSHGYVEPACHPPEGASGEPAAGRRRSAREPGPRRVVGLRREKVAILPVSAPTTTSASSKGVTLTRPRRSWTLSRGHWKLATITTGLPAHARATGAQTILDVDDVVH